MRAPEPVVHSPRGAQAAWPTLVGVSAVVVAAFTAVGILFLLTPSGATPAERWAGLTAVVVTGSTLALIGSLAVLWLDRVERPRRLLGYSVAVISVLLSTWAGWRGLQAPLRAAFVGMVPLVAPAVASTVTARRAPLTLRTSWICALGAVTMQVLTYDPARDVICTRVCSDVGTAAQALLHQDTTSVGLAASLVLSLIAAVLALASIAGRSHGWSVAAGLAAVVVLSAFLADLAHLTRLGNTGSHAPSRWWVLAGVIALGPLLSADALRTRLVRRRVDDLLRELEVPTGSAVAARRVVFALPGEDRWVDGLGRDVRPDVRPTAVEALPGVALLSSTAAADLKAGFTPARRFALGNARLTALARARLRDVRAAQRRSVERSDDEQRRIERDLHDGAQQNLVGSMFRLNAAARRTSGAPSVVIDEVRRDIEDVLGTLRRITHGVVPSVLHEEGIKAALEELRLGSDVPMQNSIAGHATVAPDVAVALYLTVLHMVPMASDAGLHVELDLGAEARLRVALPMPAAAPAALPADVTDRIEALGGRCTWLSGPDEVVLEAVVPCE